jgi:hypothetical protein
MKSMKSLAFAGALLAAGTIGAQADLLYDFSSGLDGFQNVTLEPGPAGWLGAPTAKMTHTAGGWQLPLVKEFAWGPGGGSANQQTEMQNLAWGDLDGNEARVSFDVMIDGASFPPGVATWFNFNVVGNSDGPLGWTQHENLFTVSGWHNADDPALLSMHIDQPFSYLGWEAGDTWFQIYAGSNSEAPVNFYMDNFHMYLVPEPTTFSLAGLGALALLISRRRK